MLLTALRACAEPTRLRLLTLCSQASFCVADLTDITGQSQPRLSRHLRLLVDAGLLECSREGAWAWFSLTSHPLLTRLLPLLPRPDPLLAADARASARVLAERARLASPGFQQEPSAWNELRALGLDSHRVEQALLALLPPTPVAAVLDLGTGTGRLLELLAPYASACLGIDASPAMLALARARLAKPGLAHCRVRKADAYRLGLPDAAFDLVLAQMLLHHADDPAAILAEARRVLRPGGTLIVVELDRHDRAGLDHRWPGFANAELRALLQQAGLTPRPGAAIAGPLTVRLWSARLAPLSASIGAATP